LALQLKVQRAAALFLGCLGQLLARQGHYDEARHCLDLGERLLHQVSDRFGLGQLLCRRAELEALVGDRTAADMSLAAAQEIGKELACRPESELGVSLSRAMRVMEETAGASRSDAGD
jgi:hypothetical protein